MRSSSLHIEDLHNDPRRGVETETDQGQCHPHQLEEFSASRSMKADKSTGTGWLSLEPAPSGRIEQRLENGQAQYQRTALKL